MDFLAGAYPWIKAFHIMSVIAWMAALLYLPRLFVYHAGVEAHGAQSELFKVMERRLARGIMTPAMVATWVFGVMLLATPGIVEWSQDSWFHLKFVLVLALSGLHGYLISCMRGFAQDRNLRPARFYRFVNEVPAIIMVAVVILVIVRPL